MKLPQKPREESDKQEGALTILAVGAPHRNRALISL